MSDEASKALNHAAKQLCLHASRAADLLDETGGCPDAVRAEAENEHRAGGRRVNVPVSFDSLDRTGRSAMHELAALRELGRARVFLEEQIRAAVLGLHFDAGMSGMRLAKVIGVSNATVSSWIREEKASQG